MTGGDAGRVYDVVVVGSGFGGAMTAHTLVAAGRDVLMIERGDFVARGPHNRELTSVMELGPAYSYDSPYRVLRGGDAPVIGSLFCVGGPSVFYGGVSARFRERDFDVCAEISAGSHARWPFGYDELEPYYTRAEALLGVSGEAGVDPTEPRRGAPFPAAPAELSPISQRIRASATHLGLRPFAIPLAINYTASATRSACILCGTCDCYPCSVNAKNDLATTVLAVLATNPRFRLATNTAVTRFVADGARVGAVECVARARDGTLATTTYRAREFVLAAGALASPHLLLASGLDQRNPAGQSIGRYLMRHSNALVYGYFPDLPDPAARFHKQLAINDFYFGDRRAPTLRERLGSLQQIHHPPQALVERRLPVPLNWIPKPVLRPIIAHAIGHATGMLAIAEDQPQAQNRVWIDAGRRDELGLPQLVIEHRYTSRDEAARTVLAGHARAILKGAGARFVRVQPIRTFSHAAGTVRMGDDEHSAPLDRWCKFRGVENLRVIDASCMPTVASVNPSLTVAALALRAADAMVA